MEQLNELNWGENDLMMLKDAYQAVEKANKWEWLKNEEDISFLMEEYPEVDEINKFLEYEGHSGFSYMWTMENIEWIAKHGIETYVAKFKKAKSVLNAK